MEEASRGLSGGGPAPITFVIGVGGTGKSTVAAALALKMHRDGLRVLLLSVDGTDPSTLVADTDVPCERVDPLSVLESQYRAVASALALSGRHDHGGGPSLPDPEELTAFPGAEPLTALLEVVRRANSGDWDRIVVDCPGAASWREMLATPSSIVGYLDRIWPHHSRVVASTGQDLRVGVLVAIVDRITDAASSVASVLGDSARASAIVVTGPSSRVLASTRELLAVTSFHGMHVDRVVANAVAPDLGGSAPTSVLGAHPAVFWMDRARAEHRAALDAFAETVGELRIDVVSAQPTEPVGSVPLSVVADQVDGQVGEGYGRAGLPASAPRVKRRSGSGLDSVYVMEVPLPFVDADTVAVGRVEDDVIVSAQGSRRRLRLASVLRRCTVTGAAIDDDVLTISFTPDPALWPENLQSPITGERAPGGESRDG
ncbi:MAG: ArsA-related P-loop ATPase [Rhodococcus sp. (in: high G+C Gram-positive bacteria)]